jgi:hypothetical protein
MWRTQTVLVDLLLGVEWVGDFTFYFPVPWHPACTGLDSGWPVCASALTRAERLDRGGSSYEVSLRSTQLAEAPTMRAVDRAGRPALRHTPLSHAGAPGHADFPRVTAESLGVANAVWTLRLLDSDRIMLVGRLMHYSVAISHLLISPA